MATPGNIDAQKEYNKLLEEARQYTKGLAEDLAGVLSGQTSVTREEKEILKTSQQIAGALRNMKADYATSAEMLKDIKKNEEAIAKAKAAQEDLSKNLSSSRRQEVDLATALAGEIQDQLRTVEQLQEAKIAGAQISQQDIDDAKQYLALLDADLETKLQTLTIDEQILFAAQAQTAEAEKLNELLEERRKKQAETEEKVKDATKGLSTFKGILGSIPGIAGASNKAFGAVEASIKKAAENGEQIPGKMQQAKMFTKAFFGEITNVATVFSVLLKYALKFNSDIVDTNRVLAQSKESVRDTAKEMEALANASGEFAITNSQQLQTLREISSNLKLNAEILGGENILGATKLRDQLGLAGNEAYALAQNAALNRQNVLETTKAVESQVNQFNKQNKTAINVTSILKDASSVSKTIGAQFGFNTVQIGKAATEAAKLGASLEEVYNIAGQLLNFEDSISAELEAELFLGKEINLEKARQLSLENDLEGLSKELSSNEAVRSAMLSKNRFTQEATAKALGMSLEQMSKIYYQAELNNLSAEEFKEKYGQQNLDAAEQVKIQERLSIAMQKVASSLTPVVEAIADLLSNSVALYGILGAVAAMSFVSLVTSLTSLVGMIGTVMPLLLSPWGLAVAGVAMAGYAAYKYFSDDDQKVQDGIAEDGGPFKITDKFGATAITAADDKIAVSPNLTRTNQTPAPAQAAPINLEPLLQKIDQLIASVEKGGTVTLDGQKVGQALVMANYNMGG